MALTKTEIAKLKQLVRIASELLEGVEEGVKRPKKVVKGSSKRVRRSGKELAAFRKMLKAERKKGVPVAELAREHGVSPAYIYQLP